jgi:hypothetical protein
MIALIARQGAPESSGRRKMVREIGRGGEMMEEGRGVGNRLPIDL